jgi:hypothetical protein
MNRPFPILGGLGQTKQYHGELGDQSAALGPEVLLVFCPKSQLSIVGIGDRATQLMIAFPPIYGPLYVWRKDAESI